METLSRQGANRRTVIAAELASAFEHHRAGRLKRAAALYKKVLAKSPDHPEALHLLGVIVLSEGRPERAIQLIRKAVAISPQSAEAHCNLGNAQLSAGLLVEACASYRRAIEVDPNSAVAHSNLGRVFCQQGDFSAALASCERAVEISPDLAEAHNNLGNALRGLGSLEAAAVVFRRAIQLRPGNASFYANLANVLLDLKRFDEAATHYRHAIELDPDLPVAHYGLASCQRVFGDLDAALEGYRNVLSLAPHQPLVWNELGRTLRALGRFDEAAAAFRESLAEDAEFAEGYRNLANFGQLTTDGKTLARLSTLSEKPDASAEERATAAFAMAKALDDADRFEEAFAAYERANRMYREARAAVGDYFDAQRLRQEVEETIATFDSRFFQSVVGWGNPSELPVFVLGMPRSGTSLVEQIAASHSLVFGAGELREIGNLAKELSPVLAETRGSDVVGATEAARRRNAVMRLAEMHLDRLRVLGGVAERVIDKMPDNIFMLGTIATLYPGARIIFCRRDARDICLSCYFQKFTAGQLVFSYDLADCARRYLETERLREHWRRALPLRMLDVEYEALIADLEGQSRRIIAFLGLDWEPACLEFHRTERTVETASAWQVRQPLYDRAVARWHRYEAHLAPLIDILGSVYFP